MDTAEIFGAIIELMKYVKRKKKITNSQLKSEEQDLYSITSIAVILVFRQFNKKI
jgi:hypothetical protein